MRDDVIDVLSWAAVFNHGLETNEVWRYITTKSSIEDVEDCLSKMSGIERNQGRWYFRGLAYVPTDYERRKAAAEKRLRESLPIVSRLCEEEAVLGVSITGSVASGLSHDDADIDLMIITQPNYVWRVRALAVYIEHNANSESRICPNMVLDCRNMKLRPSVYAARELAMMKPVKGRVIFEEMITKNPWFQEYLPNADLSASLKLPEPVGLLPFWWRVMRFPILGSMAEAWEARRRITRYRKGSKSIEAIYDRLRCIGHENAHRSRIEERITEITAEVSLNGK
tara:strand:+ start:406 stop:1254 length:849 start_codon:yes stop_codon:yes gene_type:complete